MARIRSIKPQLRTSLTAAEWPRDVRYLWVLLWGYLDDYGRGVDDARLVKADCFPLDDDVTAQTVDAWLAMIERSFALCRYVVDGRRYLHAPNWFNHQRPSHPTDSAIPVCPRQHRADGSHEEFANESGIAPETFVPEVEVEVEKGGVVIPAPAAPDANANESPPPKAPKPKRPDLEQPEAWARFWAAYPRKKDKALAEKAWNKAIREGADPKVIMDGVLFYRLDCANKEAQYIKYPASWLNARGWQDEPDPMPPAPRAIGAPSEAAAVQPRPFREVMAQHERTVGGNGHADAFDFGDAFRMPE